MSMIERVKAKARADRKTIVFPEGNEARTVQAAAILKNEGLAVPVLIGNAAEIRAAAAAQGADIEGIRTVDPADSPKTGLYAEELFHLREAKGLTREGADELVLDPMYFGIMMVKMGDADGLVSGAVHSTGDMLRPADRKSVV